MCTVSLMIFILRRIVPDFPYDRFLWPRCAAGFGWIVVQKSITVFDVGFLGDKITVALEASPDTDDLPPKNLVQFSGVRSEHWLP